LDSIAVLKAVTFLENQFGIQKTRLLSIHCVPEGAMEQQAQFTARNILTGGPIFYELTFQRVLPLYC
jgi:hypothetical protein